MSTYVRVRSHDERADLDWRVSWLTGWARTNGLTFGQVVAESRFRAETAPARFGPGVVRPICQGDCCEASRSAGALWVAHLQAALAGQGRQVVVVDSGDTPR